MSKQFIIAPFLNNNNIISLLKQPSFYIRSIQNFSKIIKIFITLHLHVNVKALKEVAILFLLIKTGQLSFNEPKVDVLS